jgi:uncharacterized protein
MIPLFPEFKNIEQGDRHDVEELTHDYPPYSDFNFTSMWSWDIRGQMGISKIYDNLAVRFTDYLTGIPFYSFLGKHEIGATIETLIQYAKKEGLDPVLKLVPEASITGADMTKFIIEESRDHFDYILDNELLIECKGRALHNHANYKRRFVAEHDGSLRTEILDINDKSVQDKITTLNKHWTQNKVDQEKRIFPGLEEEANRRYFSIDRTGQTFITIGIFKDDNLIAFTVDELVRDNFSIRHFMKGDVAFKGVYSYLVSESARILFRQFNIKLTNIEQDLGLQSLRQSKKSFSPVDFLKKFTLECI